METATVHDKMAARRHLRVNWGVALSMVAIVISVSSFVYPLVFASGPCVSQR